MKLTEKEIDSILDNTSPYIYDDVLSEITNEWIEDYLSDTTLYCL